MGHPCCFESPSLMASHHVNGTSLLFRKPLPDGKPPCEGQDSCVIKPINPDVHAAFASAEAVEVINVEDVDAKAAEDTNAKVLAPKGKATDGRAAKDKKLVNDADAKPVAKAKPKPKLKRSNAKLD